MDGSLLEAVSDPLERLRTVAGHRVEVVRATALDDAQRIRDDGSRRGAEVLAAARLAVREEVAAAAGEAAELLRAANAEAAQILAAAAAAAAAAASAGEAARRRQAALSADEHRARVPLRPMALRSGALADLEEVVEARRAAERSARALRVAALAAAAGVDAEAEQALREAREARIAADRDAAEVLRNALAESASRLAAAQRQLDASAELLAPPGRRPPGPATAPSEPAASPAPPTPAPAAPVAPSPPEAPYLVPALSLGRELVLRLLVFGGVVSFAWFWAWWLTIGHGAWTPGSALVTLVLAWISALPAYFYFFVCRMSRPNPVLPLPDVRVAMVVTKVPSEPWPVLRTTLMAMRAQQFSGTYDVWLADESPTPATLAWCAEHGVQVSTRQGNERYQRDTWPRRKRTKEGNLAYFYDTYGYARYDVVAQFDADHVPTPSYLEEIVRPFNDPRVGYVSAPSICDANIGEGWTVRGRLYREAAMHGPVQAGSNDGYGPVCIGSHYAVRTAALRVVGGLGPELAEDYSTTLFLQAGGWDGVFNINAEAHGGGPESLDEMLRQELQWSRSLGTILVRWAPSRLRRVPWRARARLTFSLVFYLLQGLVLILAVLLPVVGVLLRASWGETTLAGFYVHMWPSSAVGLVTAAYLRRCRLLRPTRAKLWSWELVLFQLVRWPWSSWGFFQGMLAGRSSREASFKVTPKGAAGMKPLRPQSLMPTLALALLPALAVVFVRDPGSALGLQLLAVLQACSYLVCAVAVVALHLLANRRRASTSGRAERWVTWQSGGAAALLVAVIAVPTVSAMAWRLAVA